MSTGTGLLIIDVQKGLMNTPVYRSEEVIERIQTLLGNARSTGTPVVYLQHDGWPNTPFEPNTEAWGIHPDILPQDGEPVIHKRTPDGFYGTTLQMELDARGIRHIVVAGCKTDYCVDHTTRKAISLGYDVTLASDAHSTLDSPVLPADKIVAHYNHALNYYGTRNHYVRVLTTDEIVF